MQKRIEEFIKVATERNADAQMYQLYQRLLGFCVEDDRKMLNTAWNALVTKKDLAKWDEQFLEETINPSPVTETAPPFASNLQQGQGVRGGQITTINHKYPPSSLGMSTGNTTAAQQQAQAMHMQAQIANSQMYDYYNQLHSSSIGTERPLSYFDQVKSAIGL
jgi:hypothetical protein